MRVVWTVNAQRWGQPDRQDKRVSDEGQAESGDGRMARRTVGLEETGEERAVCADGRQKSRLRETVERKHTESLSK